MKRGCEFVLLKILILTALLSGCRDVKQGEQVLGPEATVEAFCRAVAAGDMERAGELCDTVSMKGYLDAWTETWSELTEKDSSALRIAAGILSESTFTVTDVVKDGDRRIIKYTLETGDKSKNRSAVVRKEEGEWRVEGMTDAQ